MTILLPRDITAESLEKFTVRQLKALSLEVRHSDHKSTCLARVSRRRDNFAEKEEFDASREVTPTWYIRIAINSRVTAGNFQHAFMLKIVRI